MSLQIRRGTAAQLANITPALAELVFTTDTEQLYIGNGVQQGGIQITGSVSTINANALLGTTLASGVVNSSLTSVGTLNGLTVTGSLTDITGNLSVSGNIGNTLASIVEITADGISSAPQNPEIGRAHV